MPVAKPVRERAAQMPTAIAPITTRLRVLLRQMFRQAIIGIMVWIFV